MFEFSCFAQCWLHFLLALPTSAGYLAYWQLFVAATAVFNTVQNFVTVKLTRRIYNNVPENSGITLLQQEMTIYLQFVKSPLSKRELLVHGHWLLPWSGFMPPIISTTRGKPIPQQIMYNSLTTMLAFMTWLFSPTWLLLGISPRSSLSSALVHSTRASWDHL